jgi:hypothetical protein
LFAVPKVEIKAHILQYEAGGLHQNQAEATATRQKPRQSDSDAKEVVEHFSEATSSK